jgi:hypothetical protein
MTDWTCPDCGETADVHDAGPPIGWWCGACAGRPPKLPLPHKDYELPQVPCHTTQQAAKDHAQLLDQLSGTFAVTEDETADVARNLYGRMQKYRLERWAQLVAAYEADPRDVYACWNWLNEHPLFWQHAKKPMPGLPAVHESTLITDQGMIEGFEFRPVKVDPETHRISSDDTKNTATEIWYEVFPSHWPSAYRTCRFHDYRLDGGAPTYEQAIITAARTLWDTYGNDRRTFDADGPNNFDTDTDSTAADTPGGADEQEQR